MLASRDYLEDYGWGDGKLIKKEVLLKKRFRISAHEEDRTVPSKRYHSKAFSAWMMTRKEQEKATEVYFLGFILLNFCSAVNRKLDYVFLDGMIVFFFLFSSSLGFLLFIKILSHIDRSKLILTALSVGLFTSVFFATHLGLIRLLPNFRDVSWNVDSRLFLSQTYSYIQNGNSNDSNSYAGFDIQYHATPSYIAAQVFDFLKVNPSFTLFIAIPLLTLLTVYIFTEFLLRQRGMNKADAILGAVALINFSFVTSGTQKHKIMSPLVNSELMLNSQLAIAVVFATLGIQVRKLRWRNFISLVGLMSLVALKPQYIPFAILSLMILTVINLPQKGVKVILRACLPILINFALALTFLLYFTKSKMDYGYVPKIDWIDLELFLTNNLFIIALACLLFLFSKINNQKYLGVKGVQLFATMGIYLACAFILDLVYFAPSEITLERMQLFQSITPGGDSDFNQGLIILFLLIAVLFLIWILTLEDTRARAVRIVCVSLISISIMRIVGAVPKFLAPSTSGYEAVNLAPLRQVLAEAERRSNQPKFLVNDLVDPAEDYRRNGSGMYWSSIGIGEFYFSDVNTFHYLAPDAEERLKNTRMFFNTRVSDFHRRLIKSADIDFIVINKRCLPNWFSEIRPIFANSHYALISPESFSQVWYQERNTRNKYLQIRKFGDSPCL